MNAKHGHLMDDDSQVVFYTCAHLMAPPRCSAESSEAQQESLLPEKTWTQGEIRFIHVSSDFTFMSCSVSVFTSVFSTVVSDDGRMTSRALLFLGLTNMFLIGQIRTCV